MVEEISVLWYKIAAILCLVLYPDASYAQTDIFPRLVGKWREVNTAVTVSIDPDGTVLSQGGSLGGAVGRSIDGGGNFAFESKTYRCVYDIVFLENGGSSWGLRDEKTPQSCPKTGLYYKIEQIEKFAQKESAANTKSNSIESIPNGLEKESQIENRRVEIFIQNSCQEVDTTIYYRDARTKKWVYSETHNAKLNTVSRVYDDLGNPAETDTYKFLYYAETVLRRPSGKCTWTRKNREKGRVGKHKGADRDFLETTGEVRYDQIYLNLDCSRCAYDN